MIVRFSYRINGLECTYGRATLMVSNLRRSICLLALPLESLGYSTLMGAPPKEEPMLVSSTFTMTESRYTYRCATVSSAYFCNFCLRNRWVTLHLWVSNLMCSLCVLALPTESPGYTILIGAPRWVLPLLLRSTFTNTRLHYTYRCPTLSEAYVCRVLIQNKWVRVHI